LAVVCGFGLMIVMAAHDALGQEDVAETKANTHIDTTPITEPLITAGDRMHWSFAPIQRHPLPATKQSQWLRTGIDAFILEKLEAKRIQPAPEANRATLLRRLSFDLLGLPPTPNELVAFETDQSPDAYERQVDRLLASPAFGERYGQYWLDLARFAETDGYEHDKVRPNAWRYRDWVIAALNADLPYDEFIRLQLAGDEGSGFGVQGLEEEVQGPKSKVQSREAENPKSKIQNPKSEPLSPGQVATMFSLAGPDMPDINDQVERRHSLMNEMTGTVGAVFLGLQLGCAQCHNHKYDPFSQKEYYQFFAIFNNTADFNSEDPQLEVPRVGREAEYAALSDRLARVKALLAEESRRLDAARPAWEKSAGRSKLPANIAAILALPAEKRSREQTDALAAYHLSLSAEWSARNEEVKRLQANRDQVATTTLVMKAVAARPAYVAIRGDFQNRGEAVGPGVPVALGPLPPDTKLESRPLSPKAASGLPTSARSAHTLNRLGLAKWIVNPSNPLTARVAVNRLWPEVFGVGIVETAEEFGLQGDLPSHPELLDWLATEYVRLGWDTKKLLRLIVSSATYRQSSRVSDESARGLRDPMNRLLARGPRVRLSAEALRDQALAASGLLSPKMFGPPVHPYQPVNGLAAAFGPSTDWETSQGEDAHRRALYTRWRRNLPYPTMLAFDVPERAACSVRRIRTNTPLQALVTLNDPVFVEAAQALARRILTEGGRTPESRATHGFRLVLTRPPSEVELRRLVTLYKQARASLVSEPAKAAALATKPIGPIPSGMEPLEAAAWTVVGNVLLNLDEAVAKP